MKKRILCTLIFSLLVLTACGFKTSDSEFEFCYNCGSKLVEATEQESSDAVRNSVADVKNSKNCAKFGFVTDDPELLFCTECGTKFRKFLELN